MTDSTAAAHVVADHLRTLAAAVDEGLIPAPDIDVWWHDASTDDAHAVADTFAGHWQPAGHCEGISLDLPRPAKMSLHVFLTSTAPPRSSHPVTDMLLAELRAS